MSRMVRQQIYIEARQWAQLQRAAKSLGVSEANLIRRAIDQHLAAEAKRLPAEAAAWQRAVGVMHALQAQGPLPDRRRTWKRDELYAEGEDRPDDHSG